MLAEPPQNYLSPLGGRDDPGLVLLLCLFRSQWNLLGQIFSGSRLPIYLTVTVLVGRWLVDAPVRRETVLVGVPLGFAVLGAGRLRHVEHLVEGELRRGAGTAERLWTEAGLQNGGKTEIEVRLWDEDSEYGCRTSTRKHQGYSGG